MCGSVTLVEKIVIAGLIAGGAGLACAAPASAAAEEVWDNLAACESGGDWNSNTGNGFHGGLQFSPGTWTAYGGSEYAATADGATREQQIAIAEEVLAAQGWAPWAGCSSAISLPW